IANLEAQKAALTKKMGGEGFGEHAGEVVETTSKFATVEHGLERAFSQWSTLSEEIERVEKKYGEDA
ncbi:MAG TPA: hypothetical protein VLE43_20500, partial [Candidatus Saccharimonadia bacterium]|nr:hypothetical protein [Candidatus Saccharimonadia bacterium]